MGYVPPEAMEWHKERSEKEKAELAFFGDFAFTTDAMERAHQLGPEADTEVTVKRRREKAQGVFDRLSRLPITKPLWKMMALLAGVGGIAFGAMSERKEVEVDPQEEVEPEDAGEEYELKRLVYDELLDRGEVALEREAREGRASWTPEVSLEYEQIRTLSGKFEYLHKENRSLIEAYRNPRGRLENFSVLFETISTEFARSSLPNQFAQEAISDAKEVLPGMSEKDALALYQSFQPVLAKRMGVRYARELAEGLVGVLPASHSISKEVQ